MKPKAPATHFMLAFLLALVGYIVVYHCIEHRRSRNGPWRVTFTNNAANAPVILINQEMLAMTNVRITFPGEALLVTNNPVTLTFREPAPVPYEVPFGKCVFMDTTFLPGTVTFQLFDHEIELLPRVLTIDRQEHPWRSGAEITLPRGQAPPAQAKP